jgi:hypothetical protein
VVAGGHPPAPDAKKKPALALKPGDKTAGNAGKKK